MKFFTRCLLVAALVFSGALSAQVLIHSHNDYEHTRPFHDAFQADCYSIEADIYLRENNLLVAHAASEIKAGATLEKLYLEPLGKVCIAKMRTKGTGKRTLPVLMIDIKDDAEKVMPVLLSKLSEMKHHLASQGADTMPLFVISGNRPPADSFSVYPYYVQFDGRPYEQYDKDALAKIAFISDQYLKYSSWNGTNLMPAADSATLSRLVQSVHEKGKMVRLWNTPDTEEGWKAFHEIGIDIINTDQPLVCRKYFEGK